MVYRWGLRNKLLMIGIMLLLISNIMPMNLLAQQRPKLSRRDSNDRDSFRFKLSVLVNHNKDNYLYSYTLEQLDYGRLDYDSINRFEIIFPCGESAYQSIKSLQSDGWQESPTGSFFEPALGKSKSWGLQFTPTYPIAPNGDGSAKGDKTFGFSFVSKCAPTRGQWVSVSESRTDMGEVDVPCGCDGNATNISDNDPTYDERDRGSSRDNSNNKAQSRHPSTLPDPIDNDSNSKTTNQSTDNEKISVTRQEITISPDTVLKLRMQTRLTSASSKVGDKFQAELFEDIKANGLSVLPAGCRVQGRVISVEPARKGNKSGTIAINFDRLTLPSGRSIAVVGELTSLNKNERTQIDSEGHVGNSSSKRSVVFIGGGAAGGAVIGAIAGGGKGAGIGAAIGAGAGILGVLLSHGQEAVVESGTEFGLLLTQPLRIPNASVSKSTKSKFSDQEQEKVYTDYRTIYDAQEKLKELGYLHSTPNGRISPSVKRAIVDYQNDKQLEPTGLIDYPTAVSLGVVDKK